MIRYKTSFFSNYDMHGQPFEKHYANCANCDEIGGEKAHFCRPGHVALEPLIINTLHENNCVIFLERDVLSDVSCDDDDDDDDVE